MASRKRSMIWDYFVVNPEDERIAICNTRDEAISRGGANTKNYNTSNLRYHLRQKHRDKFNKLGVKEAERSEQNEAEPDSKRRKPSSRWLKLRKTKKHGLTNMHSIKK